MPGKKKSTALTRTSGGQPGNLNAFKHGFYAKKYRPLELSDLEAVHAEGLLDEISLLRVVIRRVFNYFDDLDEPDTDTYFQFSNTLGSACIRLAGLIRTNMLSGGDHNTALTELAHAFGVIHDKLGYPNPRGN
jgi:hypothetical protein